MGSPGGTSHKLLGAVEGGQAVPTRILVLDRYGRLARLVAALFPGQDYGVHVAPVTASSLPFLATFEPDLVLLWIERSSDWSLFHEIRARSRVPLILCSTSPDRADAVRGLQQGADDYVRWPSPREELGARITARLRRARWK
jgi:DNA-binding response OmpR family regulator